MNDEIVVDVLILNWNGRDVILPCIESLMAVTSPKLRITVVDNGSTDGSETLVRERYPRIDLILNERNLMFAEGNNVGIRHIMSRGAKFILLLNNDTEVDPGLLASMMKGFDHKGVGIVGPKIYYYDDPERIWYGGGGFMPLVWIPKHFDIRRLDGKDRRGPGETSWVTGCAMLVRSETFEEVGLLDPEYNIYSEDIDLCLRAARAGWRCRYEPDGKVWHKVSSSSGGGMTPFKLENRIASTMILMKRYKPCWWRLIMSPVHIVCFLLMLAGMILTGRFSLVPAALRGLRRIAAGN